MHFREGRLKIRREGIRAARDTLSPATETWKIIRLGYKSLIKSLNLFKSETWKIIRLGYKSLFKVKSDLNLNFD